MTPNLDKQVTTATRSDTSKRQTTTKNTTAMNEVAYTLVSVSAVCLVISVIMEMHEQKRNRKEWDKYMNRKDEKDKS